jgi:hypothetical protein
MWTGHKWRPNETQKKKDFLGKSKESKQRPKRMNKVNEFRIAFVGASGAGRVQIIQRAVEANKANSNIVNLLANVDYNDVTPKNRTRASSIHFIVQQLQAFPDFQF